MSPYPERGTVLHATQATIRANPWQAARSSEPRMLKKDLTMQMNTKFARDACSLRMMGSINMDVRDGVMIQVESVEPAVRGTTVICSTLITKVHPMHLLPTTGRRPTTRERRASTLECLHMHQSIVLQLDSPLPRASPV